MTESRQELIEAAVRAQEQVAQKMLALAEEDWMAIPLTLTQLKSLIALAAGGAIPMHQLAESLHLGRPATSTLVEQLVQFDLVTRTEDATDRRRTLVNLSPQGITFVTRLRQGRDDKIHSLLGMLDDDDLTALIRILRKLVQITAILR